MKKIVFLLFLTIFLNACQKQSAPENNLRFNVIISENLAEAPEAGRLLLILADNQYREPRFQINSGLKSQPVFGMNVDGLKPRESLVFD